MNKADHDASELKKRRARYNIPDPEPLLHPSVLPQENLADYELLVAEYYASLDPTCPEECSFADDIIYCEWILRRLARTETELISHVHGTAGTTHAEYPLGQPAALNAKLFTSLQWRAISTRKALKEAIDGLRDLRLHPIPDPEPPATPTAEDPLPEIGFVLEPHPELSVCNPPHSITPLSLARTPQTSAPPPHQSRDRKGASAFAALSHSGAGNPACSRLSAGSPPLVDHLLDGQIPPGGTLIAPHRE